MKDKIPHLELIEQDNIRNETEMLLENYVPDYFWEAPAATSYRHHNPYCCDDKGLWIHTLMVCTAFESLKDTYVHSGRLNEIEVDAGRAACILHDTRKFGDNWDGSGADRDHDLQAARLVKSESSLPIQVSSAIASHMGPWYQGPTPESDLEMLVHQADMAASSKNGTWGIYDKPDELRSLYPSLPEADL